MHLISSFLFAVSANIDSFIVGMSYGIKKSNISLLKSTIISLVTLTGTVIAILLGEKISLFFSHFATAFLGCFLLISLGMYYILKSGFILLLKKSKKSEVKSSESDTVHTSVQGNNLLTINEGFLLGLTLSINNFGMGIGASMTGLKLFPTAAASLIVSIIFLYTGNMIGKTKMPPITDCTADITSGLILILLGIFELFS